jgi:Zn-dependent protease
MLLRIPCVFLAISVHESAHGWAAEKLGDPTARRMGRISLNPARHFNLLGTLCMIFLGFGWATPVPINISNFKKPKRDMALSAIAGPISNLILMVIGCLFHRLALLLFVQIGWMIPMGGLLYYGTEGSLRSVMDAILLFFTVFASLNASLAVFNMIPIPPLDGSRLLTAILPTDKYFKLMRYERYLLAALLILLFTGALGGFLSSVTGTVINGAFSLLDLIPFLRIGG